MQTETKSGAADPSTNGTSVERVGVAGSGRIACGLAAVAADHGKVVLWARSDESATRAHAYLAKRGEKCAANVDITLDLGALRDSTVVIEAIVEETGAKASLYRRLHPLLPEGTMMATTTSALSVEALAAASGRPSHFAALHVFNPVTKMPLIELAFPAHASDETRGRAHALCVALGKTPVEVPDIPGFVVNRLLFPYLFDAVRLHERTGLTPEAIDGCMTLGAGHPSGPLALLDYVGLDVAVAIAEELEIDVPHRVTQLVSVGALGRKSGRGFYEHER